MTERRKRKRRRRRRQHRGFVWFCENSHGQFVAIGGILVLSFLISALLVRYEEGFLGQFFTERDPSALFRYNHGGKKNESTYPHRFERRRGRPAVALNYKRQWQLVSTKLELTMTFVPKVMSTSIRRALSGIECGDAFRRCALVRLFKNLSQVDVTNYTRVVMIRDPFERVLSAYTNSANNKFIKVKGCEGSHECSFAKWIETIHTDRKFHFDNQHFRPQRDIIQLSRMHYHYYLRLSSAIDQDFFWHALLQVNKAKRWNVSQKPQQSNASNATSQQQSTEESAAAFRKAEARFLNLTTATVRHMADLWAPDLILWQLFLDHGTPRQTGEYTMYDYYKEHWLPQFGKR